MGVGGLPVGPRSRLGQAGQFRQGRPAAGADHHRMPGCQGDRPAAGDLHGDPPVAVQPPVAADQLGAEALQSGGLPLVVPASHPLVPAGEDGRSIALLGMHAQ